MSASRICANCAHYVNLSAAKASGECRRYPPQVVTFDPGEDSETLIIKGDIFPRVSSTTWCGEHRGRN